MARILGLVNKKKGTIQTHTIRYWETQFKQIKPSIRAGRRRYYSNKDIKIINFIKYLLKEKGFTINGVKKVLNRNSGNYFIFEDYFIFQNYENISLYNLDNILTNIIKDRIIKNYYL